MKLRIIQLSTGFLLMAALMPATAFSITANDGFEPNANGDVYAIEIQPDGRILAGGYFTSIGGKSRNGIARLSVEAKTEDGFNPNANDGVFAIVALEDGKILVGGNFTEIGGQTRDRFARLDTNGSADGSFTAGANDRVIAIAVQPDGKILIGGWFTSISGQARNRIARLNADGSVDSGFNPDADDWVYAIKVQEDGKILLGGKFASIGGRPRNRIARLNSDGSVDEAFNPDIDGTVRAIAIQNDGKVVVGGEFTGIGGQVRNRIARLDYDGTVDTAFDPNANAAVTALEVMADGRIVAGGWFTAIGGQARNRLAWLAHDGTADQYAVGVDNWVYSLKAQKDGKVYAGGAFTGKLIRFHRCSVQDIAFNPNPNGFSYAIAMQQDGKIIAGGHFSSIRGIPRYRIARLHENGCADMTFSNPPNLNPNDSIVSIAVQSDGKIVLGGVFAAFGYDPFMDLVRLNTDGTLDSAFSTLVHPYLSGITAISFQEDGKILIGGRFTSVDSVPRNRIARLNNDGTLDTTFNPDANNTVYTIAVQEDGKILAGGVFTAMGSLTRNRIARLNIDGSVDTTFDPNASDTVAAIMVQPDGKILVGGNFITIAGQAVSRVARLNTDGSIDADFNNNLMANGRVNSFALQKDGKIWLGGRFTNLGIYIRPHLARLKPDGTVEGAITPPQGANDWVHGLVLQPDGRLLVSGIFTTLGGANEALSRNYLGRLSADSLPADKITVSQDGAEVMWLRGITAPEAERVRFERSADNVNWTDIGPGTRVPEGWQLSGAGLPANEIFYVRARGRYSAGYRCVANSRLESSVGQFFLDQAPPAILYVEPLPDDTVEPYGPYPVNAVATDNHALSSVRLVYQVDGIIIDTLDMLPGPADTFTVSIPEQTVTPGDTLEVSYWALASDWKLNESSSPPQNFSLIGYLDTVPPPQASLIAPANGTLAADTVFSFIWHPVIDNHAMGSYQWQASGDGSFASVLKDTTIPDTAIIHVFSSADTVLFWRVRAIDRALNQGIWSDVWNLQIDRQVPLTPQLVSPLDGGLVGDSAVVFTWGMVSKSGDGTKAAPVSYVLQVDTSYNFGSLLYCDTIALTLDTVFLVEDAYFWRVMAFDGAGNIGSWSAIRSFEVDLTPPDVPAPIAPYADSWVGDTAVVFAWAPVAKLADGAKSAPVEYVIHVDTSGAFTDPLVDTVNITLDTFVLYEGRYWWKVMAYDLAGNVGPFSDPRTFGVDTTAPLVTYVKSIPDDPDAPYGPYEVTGTVSDLSGIKAAWLFVRVNGGGWDSTAMTYLLDSLRGSIPEQTPAPDETLSVEYHLKVSDLAAHWTQSATSSFRAIGPTGVAGGPVRAIPKTFSLLGAAPNPARGRTSIEYQLPKESRVTLEVFSITGQLVKRFEEGVKQPGYYTVSWNTAQQPAGIYFYRLQSGSFMATKKLVVVK